MKTNPRLLALVRKYNKLKPAHKFALCEAAAANQNSCFSHTAKLLVDAGTRADAKVLKAYIDQCAMNHQHSTL